MELVDIATMLRRQLLGAREDFGDISLFRRNPTLIERLISKLTYCIRDEPARYIAVDVGAAAAGDDAESFRVAAYTDDHLFHLAYDPSVDHILTTIVARTSVRRIEVLAVPSITEAPSESPHGPVDVAAYYDDFTVRLPGDNLATERNRELLDTFLLSLEHDLARN